MFVSHFSGDWGVTYVIHPKLVGKLVADFLYVIIAHFANSYRWGTTSKNMWKSAFCWRMYLGHFMAKYQRWYYFYFFGAYSFISFSRMPVISCVIKAHWTTSGNCKASSLLSKCLTGGRIQKESTTTTVLLPFIIRIVGKTQRWTK